MLGPEVQTPGEHTCVHLPNKYKVLVASVRRPRGPEKREIHQPACTYPKGKSLFPEPKHYHFFKAATLAEVTQDLERCLLRLLKKEISKATSKLTCLTKTYRVPPH